MRTHAPRLSVVAVALLGLASLVAPAPAHADAPGVVAPAFPWAPSYDQAVARARASHKDLVLLFTGSDWCGFCMQLEREVFHSPEFARRATQQFDFLEVVVSAQAQFEFLCAGHAVQGETEGDVAATALCRAAFDPADLPDTAIMFNDVAALDFCCSHVDCS